MATVKMKEWGFVALAMGLGPVVLVGKVEGHPLLADGNETRTSAVIKVEDGKIRTQNTLYELDGPAHPEFVKAAKAGMAINPEPVDELDTLIRQKIAETEDRAMMN